MTHTLNNSMAGFIPECNISFNGGDLSSETGERGSCHQRNSNFSLMVQQVFKYLLGYSSQADQEVLAKDPILCQHFQGISSQSSVSRFFSRVCEDTNNAFWQIFMDQACQFISSNQDDILLDADSTKTDPYGKQEGAAWIHLFCRRS